MQNVSQEYLVLFNAITDAQEALQALYTSLLSAQQRSEELYISGSKEPA